MNCPKCGVDANEANFCPACGTPVQEQPQISYEQQAQIPYQQQPQAPYEQQPQMPYQQQPQATYQQQPPMPYQQQGQMPYQPPTIIINNTASNTNENTNTNVNNVGVVAPLVSSKSKIVALFLCFFFGVLGVHRFYVGKAGTGVLYLFTGGVWVIGAIIDFIKILSGTFRDGLGLPLRK